MTPFVLGRRAVLSCWALAGTSVLAAGMGHHVRHGHETDEDNGHADHLDILSRGPQRRFAYAPDIVEEGAASDVRDLKKHKSKKSDEGGTRHSWTKKVSCKSAPEHPDCATALVISTSSPTPAPTDQCESTSFTSAAEDYDGGSTNNGDIKFSFTNEIDFVFSCNDLLDSIASNGAIESVLVAYQNNLLMQYGCSDEISYGAAVITDSCIMGEDGACVDSIEDICPSGRERQLQHSSSIESATIRYKYNTMGNCRRRCAEKSLPKESDALGGGRLRSLGSTRRRNQDESENRDGLVALLNVAGVPAEGAVVKSDGKNDCSNGTQDCCGESGKCCGVTPGCSCPTVSQTYCTATGCDLPGCCGPYFLELINRDEPKYVGCSYLRPVCLCQTADCYPGGQCGSFGVCADPAATCPDS